MEIFIGIVVFVALLGSVRLFKKSREKEVLDSQNDKPSSWIDDLFESIKDDNQDTEKQMEPEKMNGMGQDEEKGDVPNKVTGDESNDGSNKETGEVTDNETGDETGEVEKTDTLSLMFDTLKTIGCQPVKADDGSIVVCYQGEYFKIEVKGLCCRIWDPNWNGIKADDPELPKVREAVNDTNFGYGPTVVLSEPDENNVMRFHSRYDIVLNPDSLYHHLFVKWVLDSFFYTKDNYRKCIQQLTGRQEETSSKRRPVGFATDFSDSQIDK